MTLHTGFIFLVFHALRIEHFYGSKEPTVRFLFPALHVAPSACRASPSHLPCLVNLHSNNGNNNPMYYMPGID